MLILLLILLLVAASFVVFFWAGTYFFQGYIYTEPTPGLAWQAPAAGAAVAAFVGIWCVAVAASDRASPKDIPYDTLWRFSAKVEMFGGDRPAKDLWAIKKGGQVVHYRSQRDGQTRFHYIETTDAAAPWNGARVEAVELEYQGQKVRFQAQPATERGAYRDFVSDDGWSMREYESAGTSGPTGIPLQFRTGRFIANLFFNFGLLLVLFLSLWLLLRFQWGHAAGLALVIWLAFTLTLLPMLLTTAAQVGR